VMAAGGQSDKMVSAMKVHMKQRCVKEFFYMEKNLHLLTSIPAC